MNPLKKPQRGFTRAASQGSRRGAFTLIELILSVGITSVLMLIIFGILSQAMGTWADSLDESDVARRANKVLDALASDLSSFTSYQGDNAWMEFYKDQSTDRFGVYDTSALYLITHTKDGPEDTESFEGELHAIAWKFKRSNLGTTANPQDGFILSRAVMDAENTFAGPLTQEFKTTADLEAFHQTSLRGGFSGLSVPQWKTIDGGSEVNIDEDWLDGPANIFATNILSIKFTFKALDRATKQSVSIRKNQSFAVTSEDILLLAGFRDQDNSRSADEQAALADARADARRAALEAFEAARAALAIARGEFEAIERLALGDTQAAYETALEEARAIQALLDAVTDAQGKLAPLQRAFEEAEGPYKELYALREPYQTEADEAYRLWSAFANIADLLAFVPAREKRYNEAQEAYEAAYGGDFATHDEDRQRQARSRSMDFVEAKKRLTWARKARSPAELNAQLMLQTSSEEYSAAERAMVVAYWNVLGGGFGSLRQRARDDLADARLALKNAQDPAAVQAARADIATAKADIATYEAKIDDLLATLPADQAAKITEAEAAFATAKAARDVARGYGYDEDDNYYVDATNPYQAALTAAEAAYDAADQTTRDAWATELAPIIAGYEEEEATAKDTYYNGLSSFRDSYAAEAAAIIADAPPELAALYTANPAPLEALIGARSSYRNSITNVNGDYAANDPDLIPPSLVYEALEAARAAYAASPSSEEEVFLAIGDVFGLPAITERLDEAEAALALQPDITPLEQAYNTAKALRDAAQEELTLAENALTDAQNEPDLATAIAEAEKERAEIIANAEEALANAYTAAEANPEFTAAQRKFDAAQRVYDALQLELNVLSANSFEVASSFMDHSIQQVDITLKLLTSKGARLVRAIPTSGTLAERTAAFAAIVEQHSMTFTRRVNLIGSKLGFK